MLEISKQAFLDLKLSILIQMISQLKVMQIKRTLEIVEVLFTCLSVKLINFNC